MTKIIWLMGMSEQYHGDFISFLDQEVECQRFDKPDTALASINKNRKPDVVITDQKFARTFLQTPQPLKDVPVVVAALDPSFSSVSRTLQDGAADVVLLETPISLVAAKVKHRLNSQNNTKCELLKASKIDNVYRKITTAKGRSATFTSKEFQIVMAFARLEPSLISRTELIQEVWGGVRVGQKTLDVHLFNIRKKIAPIQLEIRFEAPHSYRMCALKRSSGSSRALAAHSSNMT